MGRPLWRWKIQRRAARHALGTDEAAETEDRPGATEESSSLARSSRRYSSRFGRLWRWTLARTISVSSRVTVCGNVARESRGSRDALVGAARLEPPASSGSRAER